MAKNPSAESAPPPKKDPLVLTVSEHAALDEKAQEKFRQKGGTVTSDPAE